MPLPLPENSDLIVKNLLEKYGLVQEQQRCLELFLSSKNPEEKRKLLEESPGAKIAKIFRNYWEERISEKNLILTIKDSFNFDLKIAENLSQDLKSKVEVLKKESEKKLLEEKMEIKAREEIASSKISLERPISPPKKPEKKEEYQLPTKSFKDVYREMPSEEEYQSKF